LSLPFNKKLVQAWLKTGVKAIESDVTLAKILRDSFDIILISREI
jgi:hypothetical protein